MFSNITIKKRLTISCIVAMGGLLTVAAIGLWRISTINEHVQQVANELLPKVIWANEIIDQVNINARVLRNLVLLTDPIEIQKEMNRFNDIRRIVDDRLQKLKSVLTTSEEQAQFAKITSAREKYFEVREEYLALVRAGAREKAIAMLFGTLRDAQNAYFDALQKFIDDEEERAKSVSNVTVTIVAQTRTIIIALVITIFATVAFISSYTIRSITKPLTTLQTTAQEVAQGNLDVTIEVKTNDELGQFTKSFNTVVTNLRGIILNLVEVIHSTANAATQISSSSEETAAGAQEQSSQIAEIASAIEEMSKTIVENSKNATMAAERSKATGDKAKEGGTVVKQTIEGMNRIDDVVTKSAKLVYTLGTNSDKIGEIVQVINDIADQTNLLALNAAIEAARAGEQGRGFAVVADEVRKLAERTTKATKEIAEMIKEIQRDTMNAVAAMEQGTKEVENGKALVNRSGEVLEQIIKAASELSDIVNQVAVANEQQSSTAEQISKNITSISDIVQQSTAGIQQIAQAAESLSQLTEQLQRTVEQFKVSSNDQRGVRESQSQQKRSTIAVRHNGKLVNV
ncbi:MAG: methyl-accepting chemotaxis protein [Bacteroidetes bacterium]|nr:methyl-accepting chemotaxis protein [Bacteroidota bacterium]